MTQNADIIFVTIRLDPVFMKRMQKATAAKMALIVPLHMGHMTCAVLFMILGAILLIEIQPNLGIAVMVLILTAFFVLNREVQVMESQGGVGATEGDGQSGQAASTALIEKIVSEEPRWQGNQCFNMPLLNIFTSYICMNLEPEIQTIKCVNYIVEKSHLL